MSDTFFIPSFLTVFSIPFLFVICRKNIYKSDVSFLLKITGVLFLSAVLSPGKAYIGQKFIGILQTTVSITGGVLIFKLLEPLQKEKLKKMLFILVIALIIGSLLEVAGLIKGLSDAFRNAVYTGEYKVYENELRDIALAGFSRPKLFTSEPSLLAIGFFVVLNSWLMLDLRRTNFLLAVFATLCMLYITGSPVLIISLFVSFIMIFMRIRRTINRIYIILFCTASLAFVIMLLYLTTDLLSFFLTRWQASVRHSGTYNITSENLRMVFPYLTLIDVMRTSPLFGTGISGKELLDVYSTLPISAEQAFGNNNFAAFFIYLGTIGAVTFIYVFKKYLVRKGVKNLLLLLIIIAGLSQSMGAFESPRFWGYIFLIIGVNFKASEESPENLKNEFRAAN
ncbi:MAG: O-antigen ligase family protein [Deltaproteobacteria bacterium]|nr:O-antigen ligase family protein [Deltaproteobacteria bacterium]